MSRLITRREFVATSAAATGLAATTSPVSGQAPAIRSGGVKPVVVASANGNRFKNGGPVTAVEKTFQMMTRGDDVLDAVIAGVTICELDPEDTSGGYGGLPNANGVVQLDASCMHGPTKRAGAVGALEGIKTPSEVAKLVLKYTNHIFLVGEGAKRFALQYGFKEEDLLTPHAREVWLHWRADPNPTHHYPDRPATPGKSAPATRTHHSDAGTPH